MNRPSSIEAQLAAWAGRRQTVSPGDDEIIRALLLDSLAVMATGSEVAATRTLRRARSVQAPGRVPLIGTAESADATAAAVINATAGAAELWDDTSIWMNTHSSVPIFAALISASVDRDPTLGEVIEAYVVGLEVQLAVRALAGDSLYLRGYHSTGLLGVIGAAIAVTHLRGEPPATIARALGIAASMGSGIRAQFGSDVMPLHSGFAAERGLFAAELAETGIQPDDRAITGRFGLVECYSDAPAASGTWSGPMGLEAADIVLKRFPIGAPNMAPVDAALRVREQFGGQPDLARIAAIRCRADRWIEYTIGLDVPPARSAGRVNLPFCVVAALVHGTGIREAFLGDDPIGPEERQLIEGFAVEVGDFRDESGQRSAELEVIVGDRRVSAWSSPAAYVHPTLDGASGAAIREKVVAAFADTGDRVVDLVADGGPDLRFAELLDLVAG